MTDAKRTDPPPPDAVERVRAELREGRGRLPSRDELEAELAERLAAMDEALEQAADLAEKRRALVLRGR